MTTFAAEFEEMKLGVIIFILSMISYWSQNQAFMRENEAIADIVLPAYTVLETVSSDNGKGVLFTFEERNFRTFSSSIKKNDNIFGGRCVKLIESRRFHIKGYAFSLYQFPSGVMEHWHHLIGLGKLLI